MKFSLVAVNFNNSAYTIEMIKSLLSSIKNVSKIVIVDNNSEIDDFKKLIEYEERLNSDKLLIVRSKKNVGYFPGLNIGLAELDLKCSTYTIICNNDIIFNEVFFKELNNLSLNSRIYALCPSVITIDGIYQNPSLSEKPSQFRKLFYKLYFSNYYIGIALLRIWRFLGFGNDKRLEKDCNSRPIFIGIGAIYILTPGFFKHNNNLKYPSFLYSEELFLSKQIQETGGFQLYYPKMEVLHMESVTTSKLTKLTKYKMTQESYKLCKDYYE